MLVFAVLATACGPRRLALPAGPGTPFSDFKPILEQASAGCRLVRTLTAELALSGRAGRQRLRGRVLAGFAPDALRLEGAAPFGGPVFIFVARGGLGDLLLPRRREVLRQAPPAEILNALASISLTPDDLRAVLTGCLKASVEPISARAYANEWLIVELSDGASVYLRPSALREPQDRPQLGRGTASSGHPELVEGHRQNTGAWAIVGGRYSGLEVEYADVVGGRPGVVRVRSATLREPQEPPEPGRGAARGVGAPQAERPSGVGTPPAKRGATAGANAGAPNAGPHARQPRVGPNAAAAVGWNAQVDLEIRLSQVETNVEIDAAAFTVQVPPGTVPISIEELREAGPLGAPQ